MAGQASAGRDGGGGGRRKEAVLHDVGAAGHAAAGEAGVDPALAEALDLLAADPGLLQAAAEPGLVVLDRRLPLDEASRLDLLACDTAGAPVLVLACDEDHAASLGRIGRVLAAFRRTSGLLTRIYGDRGLDVARPPRVLLAATRFPDEFPALLDLLEVPVAAVECRVVRLRGEAVLDVSLFHRTGGRTGAARGAPRATGSNGSSGAARAGAAVGAGTAAGRPAASEPRGGEPLGGEPEELTLSELEPLAPDDLDRLADRARTSILSLSEQIEEEDDGDTLRFLVDGRPLATLERDDAAGALALRLEDAGGDAVRLPIADEPGLNGALNALFDRWFQRLDPEP